MGKRNVKRVNISALFRWKQSLPIFDHRNQEVARVYQRVINDKEYEEARLRAIRKSRETRLAMRNPEGVEYFALEESLETISKEQLLNIILLEEFPKLYEKANNEVKLQMPKSPGSDASLEQLEEYEHQVDEYDEKRSQEILKVVEQYRKQHVEKLEKLGDDEIKKLARKAMEDRICGNVINEVLMHYSAYLGTYEDEDCIIHYFKDYNEFDELATQVKEQLVRGYNTLKLTPEKLKN